MVQTSLKILLVGSGGREHALAWKLGQSPLVDHIYVVPGNGGTERMGDSVSNVSDTAADDYPGLLLLSQRLGVGLVVAGPDQAVVDGIEGYFRGSGIPCFAPSKEAAEVEGSKAFAKSFMERYGIPTAAYGSFDNYPEAKQYLESLDHRVVIKVDGLAAGKGVVLPVDKQDAERALEEIMVHGKFGSAGDSVVIEEYMDGDEISVLTFSDGKTTRTLPAGQDHKRAFDGNRGPNTGGMGVYAPVPFVSAADMGEIERLVLQPTFRGLEVDGRRFVGMLFTGIMLTSSGPKVIEYNARFGDPETQALMLLLKDTDLAQVLLSCTNGSLADATINVSSDFVCNVTVAAHGYPLDCTKGGSIALDSPPKDVQIFHAGTTYVDGRLVVAGGRVFSISATGSTLQEAVSTAYAGVKSIWFDGMFYRTDIAARCL
ncbi:putative bifunctional purine Ade1 [Xylariaceae sp. FL0594]|nr:putative bifunctional purine Ade1 [Xylariaceae sp. FL0594]